jgi:hypothetical protein
MLTVVAILQESATEPGRLRLAQQRLQFSATRYYQVANALLGTEAAWDLAPAVMAQYAAWLSARTAWRRRTPRYLTAIAGTGTPPTVRRRWDCEGQQA